MEEKVTEEAIEKISRITLILDDICPECKSSLALSDSKKSSTCIGCNKSYDLEAINLAGYHKII